MKRRIRLEWILGLVGLAFLVVALVAGWGEITASLEWSAGSMLIAIALSLVSVFLIAGSWAVIHDPGSRWRAWRRFLIVQPAKHIPGGLAQPLGMISSSASGSSAGVASVLFVRFSIVLLAAGLSVGCLLVPSPDTRLIGIASVLAAVCVALTILHPRARRGVDRVPAKLSRWVMRGRDKGQDSPTVPSNGLVVSLGLSVGGMLGLSAGFAALAMAMSVVNNPFPLIGAFGVAWAVGYLMVPIPAGLGVRESVLVFILSAAGLPGAPVVAIAVLQRLCQILAELIGVAVGYGVEFTLRTGDVDRTEVMP